MELYKTIVSKMRCSCVDKVLKVRHPKWTRGSMIEKRKNENRKITLLGYSGKCTTFKSDISGCDFRVTSGVITPKTHPELTQIRNFDFFFYDFLFKELIKK